MESMDQNQLTDLTLAALSDDAGFDYTTYLQGPSADYLGGEYLSGTPMSALNDTSAARPSGSSSTSTGNRDPGRQQRSERRGHTKSRRGCFHCKRRRIKCQETRPACGHCVKTGLQCVYPAGPQVVYQPQHQIPLFTLQDMRFFQHFLLACLPRHPLGNESVWSHEIPCLSQNYGYLMHAILGLAASDLMGQDPSLLTFAMAHRVKAIGAIKKSLADAPKSGTFEEGNALMAACFALTFQSVWMDDGMAEFMTFCRGIVIVAIQMYCRGSRFVFQNWMGSDQHSLLKPLMETVPLIPKEWTDMAVIAIDALEPLCKHQVEIEYHRHLKEWAQVLYVNSFQAYQALSKHYGWWMQIPHESFAYLIDPANQVCLLLSTHWIALKKIMTTITDAEGRVNPNARQSGDGGSDGGITRWLRYLNRQIDAEHQQYNQWPLWIQAQLDRDLKFFARVEQQV